MREEAATQQNPDRRKELGRAEDTEEVSNQESSQEKRQGSVAGAEMILRDVLDNLVEAADNAAAEIFADPKRSTLRADTREIEDETITDVLTYEAPPYLKKCGQRKQGGGEHRSGSSKEEEGKRTANEE